MSADAAPLPAKHHPHRGWVYGLLVVATLLATLSIFAIWIQRQMLSTDNWTTTSTKMLADTKIRTALSGYLVDQLYANVDVAGELQSALPPRVQALAAPAAGALRQVADRAANEALGLPPVQTLWAQANRRAHLRLLQILKGGGPAVSTDNGEVTLDLGGLLQQIETRTGVGGALAGKVQPGAAQIVILRSKNLKFAQDVANALRPLAIIITTISLALYALAMWLARGWRREVLRAVGVGLIMAGVGALLIRRVSGDAVVHGLVKNEAVRPAAFDAWHIGTGLLVSVATAAIIYGVFVFASALLAGPSHAATAVRRFLAPYLADAKVAYSALALFVLILVAWGPTQALRQWTTALILIALLAFGVEMLRRQTGREFGDSVATN